MLPQTQLTHELQCATYGGCAASIAQPLGQPEVDYLDVAISIKENVFHLEITVDDSSIMEEVWRSVVERSSLFCCLSGPINLNLKL